MNRKWEPNQQLRAFWPKSWPHLRGYFSSIIGRGRVVGATWLWTSQSKARRKQAVIAHQRAKAPWNFFVQLCCLEAPVLLCSWLIAAAEKSGIMALVEASPKVITHRARALHACSARRISSINLLFDIKHVLLGHLSRVIALLSRGK